MTRPALDTTPVRSGCAPKVARPAAVTPATSAKANHPSVGTCHSQRSRPLVTASTGTGAPYSAGLFSTDMATPPSSVESAYARGHGSRERARDTSRSVTDGGSALLLGDELLDAGELVLGQVVEENGDA